MHCNHDICIDSDLGLPNPALIRPFLANVSFGTNSDSTFKLRPVGKQIHLGIQGSCNIPNRCKCDHIDYSLVLCTKMGVQGGLDRVPLDYN